MMWRYLVLLCVILAAPYTYSAPSGSVELNELTFDSVVSRFKASIVKFDVAFPEDESQKKQDIFLQLATEAWDIDDLLFAEVGVRDYGDHDNEEFVKKYGASNANFPVVKLFLKGRDDPITFDDKNGFTNEELRRFILMNTGIYIGLPGCIRELDLLALKFMKSKTSDRQDIFKEVDGKLKAIDPLYKSTGKIYKSMFEKILEKGDDFIPAESTRVKKLLTEKISKTKKKELETRINILDTFQVYDKIPKYTDEL